MKTIFGNVILTREERKLHKITRQQFIGFISAHHPEYGLSIYCSEIDNIDEEMLSDVESSIYKEELIEDNINMYSSINEDYFSVACKVI